MEEEVVNLTTAGQLFVFLEVFRHCTRNVHTALFYAGVFSGAVAFPVYAVVLLRRGAQGYMEQVLRRLAERDPWVYATLRSKRFFETEEPFRWLSDLCRWQRRYRNVKVFFGSPDIDSKLLLVTRALLNVFLSWAGEFKSLPPPTLARLLAGLTRLQRYCHEPVLQTLIELVQAGGDPLGWIRALQDPAGQLRTWSDFLRQTGLATDLSPVQAAEQAAGNRTATALALLLFAAPQYPFREELRVFLIGLAERRPESLRLLTPHVDAVLGGDGSLVDAVAAAVRAARQTVGFDQCRGYQQFRLGFGCTPFACLGIAPESGFEAMRRGYQTRLTAARAAVAAKEPGAADQFRMVQLAWAVIRDLRDAGLVK